MRNEDRTTIFAGSMFPVAVVYKRMGKARDKILQYQTTSVYTQFICHTAIIIHISIYHPNPLS